MAPPAKGSRPRTPDGPDLFDYAAAHGAAATIERAPEVDERRPPPTTPAQKSPSRRAPRTKSQDEISVVSVNDMPSYPEELQAAIERSLMDLPADKVWFTYRDIKKHFGVSRATVARRVKEGLVPGVRRQRGRVLDEGPVRRFDRVQLRWLLLAVRARR